MLTDYEKNLEHCKDLQYNLHLVHKPAFDVPNPLILNTIMQHVSANNMNVVIPSNPEGGSTSDKDNLHHFVLQYIKYIEEDKDSFGAQVEAMTAVFKDFHAMYNSYCSNMHADIPSVAASTYIQNNQTELPATAYHGNLTMHKVKGGSEEVRCVGHLGNSFPGCACIREGKGMVNTYERMPTAVHVM